MRNKARKVVVALRMAGIAGQDKLNGIFEHLSQGHRWQMTLYRTRHEFTAETVRQNIRDGVNGFIVAIPDAEDALAELAQASVPTVVMNVTGGGIERRRKNIHFVKSDSAKVGGEAAADFLRQGNYKSYGYVGYSKPFDWSVDRGRAFAERLAQDGFMPSFHDRSQPLDRWLQSLPQPCAILASCDDDAYTILDACRTLNLKVPAEVAVLGVNNDPIICDNADPRLSSIQPDFVGEGRLAAELLERMMSGESSAPSGSQTHLVGIRGIVRRESTPPESISGLMVQKALAFINRKALTGIGVADVANHLKVSRSLLDLRFREHLGDGVYATVLKIRLAEVKRRLRATSDSIGRIAQDCGWKDPASLKNLFKRTYGLSPRDFRHGRRDVTDH